MAINTTSGIHSVTPDTSHVSAPAELDVLSAYVSSGRKRAFDVLLSLIGLAFLGMMLPSVAAVIKVTSRGPVFYRQRRVGLDGAVFEVLKFRTMRSDAESDGRAVWAETADSRITGAGRIMRRLYIDEFPQWWNVLKGEMSVVGPRPERPELIPGIVENVPDFNRRHSVKPGITGVAQVNFKYGNTMDGARQKLRLDLVYVRSASALLDVKVVLLTIKRCTMLRGT